MFCANYSRLADNMIPSLCDAVVKESRGALVSFSFGWQVVLFL